MTPPHGRDPAGASGVPRKPGRSGRSARSRAVARTTWRDGGAGDRAGNPSGGCGCGSDVRPPDAAPLPYDALLARVAGQLRRSGPRPTPAAARIAAERLVDDVTRFLLAWVKPE